MWYALRDVRSRPKQFISLVAVSAAILTVMILAVLWEGALWREDVMPEKEHNYHFYFYNLSDEDKAYIRSQPWVLTTYDVYSELESVKGTAHENAFRVRVTWENNAKSAMYARELLLRRGIIENEPYDKQYEREYNQAYGNLLEAWMGATVKNGMPIETMAKNIAITSTLDKYILNNNYTMKTLNGYTMQPTFLLRTFLLMLFLCAAILILTLETYRANFREYGTLRALGFKNGQLLLVNLCRTLLVSAAAIPVSALFTFVIVRVYYLITAPLRTSVGSVYFTIDETVPVAALFLLAICLTAASLLASVIVFAMHKSKTTMSYLRGEDTFAVSFVSKTSPRFENAAGVLGYCRLYAVRARAMLSRYTVITAIMMPLPMFYLVVGVSMLGKDSSAASQISAIYTAFQSVAVFVTTLCVTHAASRMFASSRSAELGVIRAIGGSKSTVRSVTYPIAALQFGAVLVLALLINGIITDAFATNIAVASRENAKTIAELLASGLLGVISAVCFVLPSAFSGLISFLIGFFRRPIIAAIREVE